MDGVALASAIKDLNLDVQPALILSSSSGLATKHEEARELGFDASIPKPLRRLTMASGLRALVDRAAAAEVTSGLSPANSAVRTSNDKAEMGRVLLVEDNAVNQLFVNVTLTRAGYRVDTANSGAEALNMYRALPYDAVLMDVQMPDMDGLEATRRIRERFPERRSPIIALTANAMKGDRERCLDAGMDDYLSKPIDPAALLTCLVRWTAGDRTSTVADPLSDDVDSGMQPANVA